MSQVDAPQQPPDQVRGWAGLFAALLAFMDRPWKAVALTVLLFVSATGWVLWTERAEIAQAILSHYRLPRLETGAFHKVAAPLLADTGADLAILVEISLEANLVKNVDGQLRGRPDWRPAPIPRVVFADDSDPKSIVKFIDGDVLCADASKESPVRQRREEAALGVRRSCMVGVPPILGVLVGALIIGWDTPLEPLAEKAAEAALGAAGMKLAKW